MPYESDPIAQKLNELVASQSLYFDLDGFDDLNPAEQALLGTWELANEVYNGGFMQYFFNSSRERAGPMVGVLRSFGAHETADILASAIALAGPGTRWAEPPNYILSVNSFPDEVRNELGSLEDRLYASWDDAHLKLYRYLSAHRDQLGAPEDFWTEATS